LTVEESRDGYFIAANVLGDLLEAELVTGLGCEEGCRGGGEVGVLGGLEMVVSIDVVLIKKGWCTSRVARDMVVEIE
jgi:hypothetical protein